jgi:hypothetical protein
VRCCMAEYGMGFDESLSEAEVAAWTPQVRACVAEVVQARQGRGRGGNDAVGHQADDVGM